MPPRVGSQPTGRCSAAPVQRRSGSAAFRSHGRRSRTRSPPAVVVEPGLGVPFAVARDRASSRAPGAGRGLDSARPRRRSSARPQVVGRGRAMAIASSDSNRGTMSQIVANGARSRSPKAGVLPVSGLGVPETPIGGATPDFGECPGSRCRGQRRRVGGPPAGPGPPRRRQRRRRPPVRREWRERPPVRPAGRPRLSAPARRSGCCSWAAHQRM